MPVYKQSSQDIGRALDHELLIVMPVYNEGANIKAVLNEWMTELLNHAEQFAFIIVNDGSNDDTQLILEEFEKANPEHFVIVHKSNSGHGNSCRVGYDVAASSSCEWVFQIDSDGQCDPQYFSNFWRNRNEVDCVFGLRHSRDDGKARAMTSQICRWSSSLVCGADLRDPNVPFRLMRRTVLASALVHIPPSFNIQNVALTFVLKKMQEVRWGVVPIHFRDRQGGTNSINLLNVAQWGFDMLFDLVKLRKDLKNRLT